MLVGGLIGHVNDANKDCAVYSAQLPLQFCATVGFDDAQQDYSQKNHSITLLVTAWKVIFKPPKNGTKLQDA